MKNKKEKRLKYQDKNISVQMKSKCLVPKPHRIEHDLLNTK